MGSDWFPSEGFAGERNLDGVLQCQGVIHLFGGQESVPLGHGPARVGQHVCPVPQLVARGITAQEDLPDGIIPADVVMVPHGNHQPDPLQGEREHSGGGDGNVFFFNILLLTDDF